MEWFPRQLRSLSNIRSIASGFFSSGCIDRNGKPFTWGNGLYWQLGHGDVPHHQYFPRRVSASLSLSLSLDIFKAVLFCRPYLMVSLYCLQLEGINVCGSLSLGQMHRQGPGLSHISLPAALQSLYDNIPAFSFTQLGH